MIKRFWFRMVKRRRKVWRVLRRKGNTKEYAQYKNVALKLVLERLEYFNQFYGFTYHKVTIRNQKTRWGSCSKAGNLNFSYRIALLPSCLADYIIVHELCHLGQFNHSQTFWNLVAQQFPDHPKLCKNLKHISQLST